MRNNKPNLYCNFLKIYGIAFFLVILSISAHSQTLQRESIASGGDYIINQGTLIQQTIGQPYGTQTSYGNQITYRPGFQQPIFKLELIHSTISLKVFPNPASSSVTIQSSTTLADVLIQINDMSGKILISQQISEFNSYSLNCENWANGLYTISVSDAKNNQYSSKLIISR